MDVLRVNPFSIYNQKGDKNTKDSSKLKDEKWKLLYSFANLIDEVEPEIISMENVPLLLTFDKGKVFKDFVNRLKEKKYFIPVVH